MQQSSATLQQVLIVRVLVPFVSCFVSDFLLFYEFFYQVSISIVVFFVVVISLGWRVKC